MSGFTHFDEQGNARMVDVGGKEGDRARRHRARAPSSCSPATIALIRQGGIKKGDVLSVARLAGIMGAKKTPDLIPLCHPLSLSSVTVDLSVDAARNAIDITGDLQAHRQDRRGDGGFDRRLGRGLDRL